jgi:hypothetical protein
MTGFSCGRRHNDSVFNLISVQSEVEPKFSLRLSQTGRSERLMKIDEKGSLGVIKKGRSGGNPKDLGIMPGKCLGAGHIAVGGGR